MEYFYLITIMVLGFTIYSILFINKSKKDKENNLLRIKITSKQTKSKVKKY